MTFLDVGKRECEVSISLVVVVVKVVVVRCWWWWWGRSVSQKSHFSKTTNFLELAISVSFTFYILYLNHMKLPRVRFQLALSDVTLHMRVHVICPSCCLWFMSPAI